MIPFLAALFAFALQTDKPLPKIAEIETVSGDVRLTDPKGEARVPTKFGRRLKNADVRDEDRVKTGAGAQAVIIFPDRSKFTLKENSEIQILQKTLPRPTPEGNTVGRRIRLLVGDLVSDVMPNKEIRTEFETPAGSAAIRGTVLTLGYDPARRSMKLDVSEGRVRYFNTEFSTVLNFPPGSSATFALGSLHITVLAGSGIEGSIGNRDCRLDAGDACALNMQGGQVACDVKAGGVELKNPQGQYENTQNDFQAAPDADAANEGSVFDPNAESFDGGASETPSTGEDALVEPAPGSAENSTSSTCTGVATSGSDEQFSGTAEDFASPSSPTAMTIDDFERPDGPLDQWNVESGSWSILGGSASADLNLGGYPGATAAISRDIGHLSTWDVQADFAISSSSIETKLHVNATAGLDGCFVEYNPSFNGGTLFVGDSTATLGSAGNVGVAYSSTFYTTGLSFDGANLCGSVSGAGLTGTTVCVGSSFS